MNKEEFIETIKLYQGRIGRWEIELEKFGEGEFVLGYAFDEERQKWVVYENSERGIKYEWLFESEEKALDKLCKKIKFQYKISN